MPIEIKKPTNPILEVVLSCESGEPDTLSLMPATSSYDMPTLRYENADDTRRCGSVQATCDNLKTFGEACIKIAAAAKKLGAA